SGQRQRRQMGCDIAMADQQQVFHRATSGWVDGGRRLQGFLHLASAECKSRWCRAGAPEGAAHPPTERLVIRCYAVLGGCPLASGGVQIAAVPGRGVPDGAVHPPMERLVFRYYAARG